MNGCSTNRPLKRHHSSSSRSNSQKKKKKNCSFRLFFLAIVVLYITVFFTCPGALPPPGPVYRSHELFNNLWPHIHSDNASTIIQLSSVWSYPTTRLQHQKPCSNTTWRHTGFAHPTKYLIVEANGGLNQQRSSICNAVALAWILNATLVIPEFYFNSIWKDPSGFGDIYDEDHFINTLEGYVTVIKKLPDDMMERYKYNLSSIPNIGVRGWAPISYYLREVYPVLREQRVIRIAPFANRLAMEIPPNLQFLRCLTNYKALRFSNDIATIAKKLVDRMAENSMKTAGKYVSVHLRFEEDMVAFSGCVYDGGETEKVEMDSAREKGWGDKFKLKDRLSKPGLNRREGRCPMTPLEVGMMLRGMGFDSNTSIYLASGKIYQAKRNLAPLLKMFPMLQTKESLLTEDEFASFEGYSSRLAALDYTVCLFSEVFVTTQGGNFPHFLIGHRRFLCGHAKTIKPDKRRLVVLMNNTDISWESFKKDMKKMLSESDRQGTLVPNVRKANRHFPVYMYPSQECRCLQGQQNQTKLSVQQS